MRNTVARALTAPLARVIWRLALICITLTTLTRLAIAARLETTGWASDPLGVIAALGAGLVADTGMALLLAAPWAVLLAIATRRWLRALAYAGLAIWLTTVVFGVVAEILFWEEFASRLNGIAVFYLLYPREVIGNLQESFDLGLLLPPIAALGLLLAWHERHAVRAALDDARPRGRWLRGVAISATSAALGLTVLGAAPHAVSANREINELARNGTANMLGAALTNDSRYDGVYPGIEEQLALPLVRSMVAQDNSTFLDSPKMRSIRRWVDNGPGDGSASRPLNVVIVLEESFGARFVDVLDDTLPQVITPNLNRLSEQSLFFTNVYASGQRTVRGLEAVLTSFAPIPGISTARRPGSKGMHSLPRVLGGLGYQSAMLYGGRAIFDNMGAFWKGIGFEQVWDQGDINHQSFTTAWGVSDDDLFAEAIERMDGLAAAGQPFLLGLLTVSNHRPYRFPQTKVKWDNSIGNRQNASRYADQAFADFLHNARTHTWFDDTVFVFVADHGHKVNGAAEVPLHRYRIPMLFYAPSHVVPRKVDTLAAQIDLAPTLLGLLGLSYESNFFGVDLMRVPEGGGRIVVDHSFKVAFARPGHAAVLGPDGQVRGYAFTPGIEHLAPERVDAAVGADARALTQTAHRMFYAGEYHVDRPARPPRGARIYADAREASKNARYPGL